jgi:hypothetical protein
MDASVPTSSGPFYTFESWANSWGRGGDEAWMGVGLCAAGTDSEDCWGRCAGQGPQCTDAKDARYEAINAEETSNVASCTWVVGPTAGSSRCTYAPDKGCLAWREIDMVLIDAEIQDVLTHSFAPGFISALREVSAAIPDGLPEPHPPTWADFSGWTLSFINGDWAGVGAQCARFADAFDAVDWSQVDMDVEADAAAVDPHLAADDEYAEIDRHATFVAMKLYCEKMADGL